MIRDLGNCGNREKLTRILNAWKSAKDNNCGVMIVLDELCYGKSGTFRFEPQEVYNLDAAGDAHDLYIINNDKVVAKYPWWDIKKVNVLW